ncbi:MAG: RIP metalloprotease RseP [Chloroflexi bacterium]|nr:RIP metalloprotease RseP [Chloroflexota bacterium]
MLLSALAFIFVFGLVVLVHELGHFVMAKLGKITVLEVGLGYPPRLKTLAVRNNIEYTLNAIPLGGFVRMLGEEDPTDPGSFASKSARVRIGTLLAGSVMNVLLAVVLFSGLYVLGEQVPVGRVSIESVAPGSPAEQAGLQAGDVILSLEGQEVRNTLELVQRTRDLLGQQISMSVLRGNEELLVRLTPRKEPPEGEGAMGVSISMPEGYEIETIHHPIWEAIPLGLRETGATLVAMIGGFARLFRGHVPASEIAGPVGIFQITSEVARTGWANLLSFTAFLSLNLSILNLLPVPALDGGRIAFVLLEKVRGGRRMAPQHEGLVNLIGLLLLLAFVAFVSYFDILRLFSGQTLLP